MFLALGRPVITEDTGAAGFLPTQSGFRFVQNLGEAETAAEEVLHNWDQLAREARDCAMSAFDSEKNLRKILGI
jgi:hypothetical protein